VGQKPKGVTRMLNLCLVIQRAVHITPLGFCLRGTVNAASLNLGKTTSSVLFSYSSVFLIFIVLHFSFYEILYMNLNKIKTLKSHLQMVFKSLVEV